MRKNEQILIAVLSVLVLGFLYLRWKKSKKTPAVPSVPPATPSSVPPPSGTTPVRLGSSNGLPRVHPMVASINPLTGYTQPFSYNL